MLPILFLWYGAGRGCVGGTAVQRQYHDDGAAGSGDEMMMMMCH